MNTSYDREIPKELIKGCHYYIIHNKYISYADFLGNRQNAIKYLQDNKLEIINIEFERNMYGLNDYRIIVRKESR